MRGAGMWGRVRDAERGARCGDVGGGTPTPWATEGVAATTVIDLTEVVISTLSMIAGHLPPNVDLTLPPSASGGSHAAQASGMHGAQFMLQLARHAVVAHTVSFVQPTAQSPPPLAVVATACV